MFKYKEKISWKCIMEALLMIFTTLFSITTHNDILQIFFTNNPGKKSKYIFLQILYPLTPINFWIVQ